MTLHDGRLRDRYKSGSILGYLAKIVRKRKTVTTRKLAADRGRNAFTETTNYVVARE